MAIDTYERHKEAQNLLDVIYTTLRHNGFEAPVPDCCSHTPVVTYTEAEYIRDRMHLAEILPSDLLTPIKQWVERWDGRRKAQDAYHPVIDSEAEVKALRNTPCPMLQNGRCLVAGMEPLSCVGHSVPNEAREVVRQNMQNVINILPQRTGFLPTQLWALLDLEGFTAAAVSKQVPDSVLAQGGL